MANIQCSAGYAVSMYWDAVPISINQKRIDPLKKYCVVIDGVVVLDTNDFHEARTRYLADCEEKHGVDEHVHTEINLADQRIVSGSIQNVAEIAGS